MSIAKIAAGKNQSTSQCIRKAFAYEMVRFSFLLQMSLWCVVERYIINTVLYGSARNDIAEIARNDIFKLQMQ
jgi:hypothetical protein